MKKIIYLAFVALTLTSCKTYTTEYYSVYHEIIGKEADNEFSKIPPSYHDEVGNNMIVRTPNIKVIGTVAMPDGQVKYIFEERLYNTKENKSSSENGTGYTSRRERK